MDLTSLSVNYIFCNVYVDTYVFNKSTLVLEGITLAELVQLVVEVLIDLAGRSVLDKESAQNS